MAGTSSIQHVYFFLDSGRHHAAPPNAQTASASACSSPHGLKMQDKLQAHPRNAYNHASTSSLLVACPSSAVALAFGGLSPSSLHTHTGTPTTPTFISPPSSPVDSINSDKTSSISSLKSNATASLDPLARTFDPSATSSTKGSPPTATTSGTTPNYAVGESYGKGIGLFATKSICRGSLLFRETPLIAVSNYLPEVWRAYTALPQSRQAAFDQLHFYQPEYLDLESASRFHLIDNYVDLSSATAEKLVVDQVKVMGKFAANNFATIDDNHLAVFETISRLNHSCVPNVYHFYDVVEGSMTVYAVRDIAAGTELLTNYIQGASAYQVRIQRVEQLRCKYGFTCQCVACSDRTTASDSRRGMLNDIMWGLGRFLETGPAPPSDPYDYHPSSLDMARKQAEDALNLFRTEGIINLELLKAFRIASMLSVNAEDLMAASQFTAFEAEIEHTYMGTNVSQLLTMGYGPAGAWAQHVQSLMVQEKQSKMPSSKKKRKNKKSTPGPRSGGPAVATPADGSYQEVA